MKKEKGKGKDKNRKENTRKEKKRKNYVPEWSWTGVVRRQFPYLLSCGNSGSVWWSARNIFLCVGNSSAERSNPKPCKRQQHVSEGKMDISPAWFHMLELQTVENKQNGDGMTYRYKRR